MAGFTPSKKVNTDFNSGTAYRNKVDTPSAQDLNNIIEGLLYAQENGQGGSVPTKVSQLENDAGYLTKDTIPLADKSKGNIGGVKVKPIYNGYTGLWVTLTEDGFAVAQIKAGNSISIDSTSKISVVTTDEIASNIVAPVSSRAVAEKIGDIETLLKSI